MQFMHITCVMLSIILNLLASWNGQLNVAQGDKDILFPFCSMLFFFFSILIYLPEAQFSIVQFRLSDQISDKLKAKQQDELFPLTFFVTLVSIGLALITHTIYKHMTKPEPESEQAKLNNNEQNNNVSESNIHITNQRQNQIIKYFLPIAYALQNVTMAFFLAKENSINRIAVFSIFSVLINFSYGYLLRNYETKANLVLLLTVFANLGIVVGYFLGFILVKNIAILILPSICCGIFIYVAAFICLPQIYTQDGSNPTHDKFRYGSVFTAFLLTLIYYPFCYLLRV